MMLACAWTALLLLPTVGPLALSQQGADAPARSPAVTGGKDERAAQASDYYAKGRYVEASLEFEGLWRDFPDEPKFLFNAAASRYTAGHYAHTVAYLTEYLARGEVQGDDRKEAQAQLDEARNKVTSLRVTVQLPPDGTGEVTVVVQHVARGASDLRPELSFPARATGAAAEVVVQLEPSDWVVRAQGPGYAPVEQRVTVTKAAAGRDVTLRLTHAPAENPGGPNLETAPAVTEVPVDVAHKLQLGFAAGGGAVAAVGVAVLAVGAVQRGRLADCDTPADGYLACRKDLAASLRMRDAGAGVFGAGVGVLVGGLTWMARDSKRRRTIWIAEAAVGGAALVGGAVGLTLASRAFNQGNNEVAVTDWSGHYSGVGVGVGHATSAAFFGLGAGLVGSAVAGLLVQRKYRSKRSAALRSLRFDGGVASGRALFVLSGRF